MSFYHKAHSNCMVFLMQTGLGVRILGIPCTGIAYSLALTVSLGMRKSMEVARSSAKAGYTSVDLAVSELTWIVSLLYDVNVF